MGHAVVFARNVTLALWTAYAGLHENIVLRMRTHPGDRVISHTRIVAWLIHTYYIGFSLD